MAEEREELARLIRENVRVAVSNYGLSADLEDVDEAADAILTAGFTRTPTEAGWRPTSLEFRAFALKHDHFAIPIRPGVTITWTDEETGEVYGRATIKGKNVVPLPPRSAPDAG